MGALISLLGGLSKGAGDTFNKISEEKRQAQVKNNELMASSLEERLNNDQNLLPEEQDQLLRQVGKLRGMKPDMIEEISQAAGHMRTAHDLAFGKQGGGRGNGGGGDQTPSTPSQSPTPQLGSGPIPTAPATSTTGDQSQSSPQTQGVTPASPLPTMQAPFYPPFHDPQNPTIERATNADELTQNKKAREDWTKQANESSRRIAETVATQEETTKRTLAIEDARHERLLGDLGRLTKSNQGHWKIENIGGQERLMPDAGTQQGTVYGGELDPGEVPDPEQIYRRIYFSGDGKTEYKPVSKAITSTYNAPDSPTGAWKEVHDQNGRFISKIPTNPQASLLPVTTTTGNTRESVQETTDAEGNVRKTKVPLSTSGSSTRVRGTLPTSPLPTASGNPTPGQPVPRVGGRDLGIAPTQVKEQWKNEYTPGAIAIFESNEPVQKQVTRAMQLLEKNKDSNIPFQTLVQRGLYAAGIDTEASKLINNLELGKVLGASRILKGASRSMTALNLAMQHLPDVKTDSPKLMYEKLQNIQQNLSDIDAAARKEGRRLPNAPFSALPTLDIPATPINAEAIDRLVKKHGGQ